MLGLMAFLVVVIVAIVAMLLIAAALAAPQIDKPWKQVAPGLETARAADLGGDPGCAARVLVIDPAAHNEAAIRCCTRAGFRPVGVMRRYERSTDGDWHDGLLMDMLASELRFRL